PPALYKLAIKIAPLKTPLPAPAFSKSPLPITRMIPLKLGFPDWLNTPVTSNRPAPEALPMLKSPLTTVMSGLASFPRLTPAGLLPKTWSALLVTLVTRVCRPPTVLRTPSCELTLSTAGVVPLTPVYRAGFGIALVMVVSAALSKAPTAATFCPPGPQDFTSLPVTLKALELGAPKTGFGPPKTMAPGIGGRTMDATSY